MPATKSGEWQLRASSSDFLGKRALFLCIEPDWAEEVQWFRLATREQDFTIVSPSLGRMVAPRRDQPLGSQPAIFPDFIVR
jgi:hypothetical protein